MDNHYFIGIKVPLAIAQSLVNQRDAWKRSAHKHYPLAEDLHITLVFIGGDPGGEILDVSEALGKISHNSFKVKVTGTGYFGKRDRPRVVYGAIEDNKPLIELQNKIKEVLDDYKLSPDNKPFVPHITLANKWSAKEQWDELPEVEPESFLAEEFTLFQIDPNRIPRYMAIKTYALKEDV